MHLKQPSEQLPSSEWFYPFSAENVPAAGKTVKIKAPPENLGPIAERLGVKEVLSVDADMRLSLQNGGHILYISGHFEADVVQECVTTLEPVTSHVADDFEAWYADHSKAVSFSRAKHQVKASEEGDEVQMLDEKDDPEPLVDGQVDLGEVVIQFLSLAINPYPRKEDVKNTVEDAPSESASDAPSPATLRPNPFAALKNWRPKD